MGSFVKKDMLLMLRDRKELTILVLMPFILIAILGFALGGFVNGGTISLDMTFILVDEDDNASGKERLIQEIHDSSILPEDVKLQLIETADSIQPREMLVALLDSEEFAAVGEYTEMRLPDARKALEREEAVAILHIPQGFTYDMLKKMLLGSGEGAVIGLEGSATYALSAGILQDIMESFAYSVNFQTAVQQVSAVQGSAEGIDEALLSSNTVEGGVEFVSVNEPVNSMQYYTIGMAVLFVMYVATSIASKAYGERNQFTFDRIMIAGSHPLQFLSGKFISTVILAFIQLCLLFLLSTIVFQSFAGKSVDFWIGMLTVTAALALCMGGLATLLTSLNFRSGNENSSEVFGSLLVMMLAFVGGSFFPTSQMSEWIGAIGKWTPNGGALYSYMQITQGAGFDRYALPIVRLLIMSALFIAAGLWVFPRRREG